MEFLANLEQSNNSEGLTAEKLNYLEQVFKDAVGERQEIDLENFKRIVQSKNMFFVERIFHVFDADGSGSVSLEEFMRVMRCFAQQSPVEKLRYLFNVYDLNDDSTIQFNELRSVISECMEENGLKFQEAEIDELTKMLFEDADTDGSGSINFDEFKNQLERHPAFMKNLTLSLERWLLPPMIKKSNPVTDYFMKKRVTWQRIRNNWTSVVFLFAFFVVNFLIFISRAYQYSDSNTYVIIARACGQCLNFNCSFIVVLVLRQTLTWLRTHGFSQYFPIDQHLYYHKLTGWLILFYSYLHTFMHIGNFSVISEQMNIPLYELLISTKYGIGWVGGAACLTGWILLAVLSIMCISSMPFVRRNGKFEIFHCLHLLSFVFWILLILHGPNFWKWFIGPAVLFIVELAIRINRNLSSSKMAYVQQGVLLPSKVTHLVIKRPPKFDFRPGDYVYINIPEIAKFEWHPFTISSAPELDDVIWIHIRGVGEWTNSLYSYFDRADKEAVLSDELAKDMGKDMISSTKSEVDDKVSMAVNCSSMRSITPSMLGDMSLTPNFFENSTLQLTPGNDDTVIEVGQSATILDDAFLDTTYTKPETIANDTNNIIIQVEKDKQLSVTSKESAESSLSSRSLSLYLPHRRTSFSSTSVSRVVQAKNKEDLKSLMVETHRNSLRVESVTPVGSRSPLSRWHKEKRRSIRISVAKKGLRRCQTVIVMPTVNDDEEEEVNPLLTPSVLKTEEEMKDLKREVEVENVIVAQKPLKIFLDGPYGTPTRHIFHARHAVLIATGIGVTPFASILQSIMYQYRKSRHTCPKCSHKWSDPLPVSSMHLKKVDFFWLNRHQRAFEWFVNLLSELEIEQAQLNEQDRFLDIHMYITSALNSADMKAVGLQMALDLLYQKEKRDLITGLKSRTQPGRPDWNKVFKSIAEQNKGKVTVFFCGPNQLAKTLQIKCDEFGFRFRKEIF